MTESTEKNAISFLQFKNRYIFDGTLELQTAMHIGGGRLSLSSTDNPIVMTPDQQPFVPGSSFKGALRSTIEKLVPSLPTENGLKTCALQESDDIDCSTAKQKTIANERRQDPEKWSQKKLLDGLCDTCRLFGSPFAAARANIQDLYLADPLWSASTQIRDGVAIDRDSERARNALKYDFEVVPATTAFKLVINLENASRQDLQLLCIGLSDFVNGFGGVGGKRSRGLGACTLKNLTVRWLDLEESDETKRNKHLKEYLLNRTFPYPAEGESSETFLNQQIESIFR